MTVPPPEIDGGNIQAQVLIELGKLQTAVAVTNERLAVLPDHESRLRELERQGQQEAGGRDLWARILAGVAVVGTVGATVAQYIHR